MKLKLTTKLLKLSMLCTVAISASVVTPSALSVLPGVNLATVQAAEKQKTTRVPALREKVYSQLARAQKLADDGDSKAGLDALDSIQARSSSMNSYEIARCKVSNRCVFCLKGRRGGGKSRRAK